MGDIDALKDIPGYKAILKSVLKSQIQLLIEQLSNQTGEETIILTASVNDGSLSHLGSSTGKGFLEGRDEIKSQFLGYCLKSHHRAKAQDSKSPYQRTSPRPRSPLQQGQAKRQKLHPVSLISHQSEIDRPPPHHLPSNAAGSIHGRQGSEDSDINVKQEHDNSEGWSGGDQDSSLPSSIQFPHTQTSGNHDNNEKSDLDPQNQNIDNSINPGARNIKIEPGAENETDLEITGVDYGDPGSESWGQGQDQSGYLAEGEDMSSSFSQGADQSGYKYSFMESETLKEHKCDKCDSSFLLVSELKFHKKYIHPSPTECVICQVMFSSLYELKLHQRAIHLDLKNYDCDDCTNKFVSKRDLMEHRRQFHDEEKLKCDKCFAGFAYARNLKRHKKQCGLKGTKRFECGMCDEKYKTRRELQAHIKVIHIGNQVICHLCGQSFDISYSLADHIKEAHPEFCTDSKEHISDFPKQDSDGPSGGPDVPFDGSERSFEGSELQKSESEGAVAQ